ncbi:actin-depolymerizing factor 3 [Nematostella vectensis]|uniref:actin-depolymerizing factor 3 n=1 Tax=Nematostella vectensis TaxID=45351 RepID=UPI002076FAB0|nr:actin-depolymerizing factor 3 [Nematostella vectensis]
MSMSGIKIDDESLLLYQTMQGKEKSHKFATFKISDDGKMVVIDHILKRVDTHTREEDRAIFDQMLEKLSDSEPRYILYDLNFPRKDGRAFHYLVYIFWCSDNAPIKKRMVSAATNELLKTKFVVKKVFQINDRADLNYDDIADKAEQGSK